MFYLRPKTVYATEWDKHSYVSAKKKPFYKSKMYQFNGQL